MPQPAGPGRPLKYNTAEEVQAVIDQYFIDCDNTMIDKPMVQKGEIIQIPTPTPYTMAGLAVALGVSRETVNQWKKGAHRDERISDIIMCARDRIQAQNVTKAMIGCYDSRIAALNLTSNFGYSDKSEVGISAPGGGPIEFSALEKASKLASLLEAIKRHTKKDEA